VSAERAVKATVIAVFGVGAIVILCDAVLTRGLLSTGDSGSHDTQLLRLQLILAACALVPVLITIVTILMDSLKLAAVIGAATVALYVWWGIANDRALHQPQPSALVTHADASACQSLSVCSAQAAPEG
jgi:hypothetical protein